MIIKGVVGVVMGCRAVVTNTKNSKSVEAVVADGGPSNKLGEISLDVSKGSECLFRQELKAFRHLPSAANKASEDDDEESPGVSNLGPISKRCACV